MSRVYEAVYIFDSTLEDAAINDKLTRYHGLLHAQGEASVNGAVSIALQLLPPFIAGQVLQRRLELWMKRNQKAWRKWKTKPFFPSRMPNRKK